jgi:2-phosphoglycerate kinase
MSSVTEESLRDALREVVRALDQEPGLKTRNASVFTAWDIANKASNGEI